MTLTIGIGNFRWRTMIKLIENFRAKIVLLFFALLILLFSGVVTAQSFKITTITKGLEHPWGMAFLPNGDMLVTERSGRLRLIQDGKLEQKAIAGLPSIQANGQGGLLDVILHPDYLKNGWIYFSYAEPGEKGMGTAVSRARLKDLQLLDVEKIFSMNIKNGGGRHFGSRLLFDEKGYLYITIGDRGEQDRAQLLNDHAGSVIRLHDDGRLPKDNPFVKQPGVKAEIYSYGHRNPQGMSLHPQTGEVWIHEHGPQGGDELNRIQPGKNYGWPVITFGVNYFFGTKIGEGTHKEGMEQPLYHWVPSIAPSGMAFYTGDKFPEWKNNLFIGSLKFQLLVRLELQGGKVVKEERLLEGKLGRIRDVRTGPDGFLYLLTDKNNGAVVRLEPL